MHAHNMHLAEETEDQNRQKEKRKKEVNSRQKAKLEKRGNKTGMIYEQGSTKTRLLGGFRNGGLLYTM